jgi:hypothetical protein
MPHLFPQHKTPAPTFVDAVANTAASILIVTLCWLAPTYYLDHDPDLKRAPDPDFRAALVFPLAALIGLAFALRAFSAYNQARRNRRLERGLHETV